MYLQENESIEAALLILYPSLNTVLTPLSDWNESSTSFDRPRTLLEVAVMVDGGNSSPEEFIGLKQQVDYQRKLMENNKITAEDFRQFQDLSMSVWNGLLDGLHWGPNAKDR